MPRRSTLFACALAASGTTAAVAAIAAGAAPPTPPTPPATIAGTLITRQPQTAKVGTTVPAGNLSQRVFVSSKVGFALGAVGEAQYPAETTNGGASWKTFGPALHVNAAQAPLSVTEVGGGNKRV